MIMKLPYRVYPWLLVLLVFASCKSDATRAQDRLHAQLLAVQSAFDNQMTSTAMILGEKLLADMKPLTPEKGLTTDEWRLLSYQRITGQYVKRLMFWAAYKDAPAYGPPDRFARETLVAAEYIYQHRLDSSQLNDESVANIGWTMAVAEKEKGETSASVAWSESIRNYLDLAISAKGETPDLIWLKGLSLEYLMYSSASSTDTEHLVEISREGLDLQMRGLVSQKDDPEAIAYMANNLYDGGCWLYWNDGISPKELDDYITHLQSMKVPAFAPVLAALYRVRMEYEWDFGQLTEAYRFGLSSLQITESEPEALNLHVAVLSDLCGIALELGQEDDAEKFIAEMTRLVKNAQVSKEEKYTLESALLDCRSALAFHQRDQSRLLESNQQIVALPGFKLENPDHFFNKCGALSQLASFANPQAASYLGELRDIQDSVKELDDNLAADLDTTTVKNMELTTHAWVFGHYWYDEPLNLVFPDQKDLRKWGSSDLYTLLEKAWLETDGEVMTEATAELLRRGTSDKYLETTLWWYAQE